MRPGTGLPSLLHEVSQRFVDHCLELTTLFRRDFANLGKGFAIDPGGRTSGGSQASAASRSAESSVTIIMMPEPPSRPTHLPLCRAHSCCRRGPLRHAADLRCSPSSPAAAPRTGRVGRRPPHPREHLPRRPRRRLPGGHLPRRALGRGGRRKRRRPRDPPPRPHRGSAGAAVLARRKFAGLGLRTAGGSPSAGRKPLRRSVGDPDAVPADRRARGSPRSRLVSRRSDRRGHGEREPAARTSWLVPAGGGEPRQLTSGAMTADEVRFGVSWSPDGETVAYVANKRTPGPTTSGWRRWRPEPSVS